MDCDDFDDICVRKRRYIEEIEQLINSSSVDKSNLCVEEDDDGDAYIYCYDCHDGSKFAMNFDGDVTPPKQALEKFHQGRIKHDIALQY